MAKKIKKDTESLNAVANNLFVFDKKTLLLLENFVSINPSLEFIKGNKIDTISITKTMYASGYLNIQIPFNFVVNDLAKMLNVINLFDQHCIEFDKHFLTIMNTAKTQKFQMNYGKVDLIITPERDQTIELPSVDLQFLISKDQLQRIFKASNIIGVTDIQIESTPHKPITISGVNLRDTSSDKFSIELTGTVTKPLNCSIKIEDLKIIHDDYVVDVSDQGVAFFKGTLDQQYYIGIEV